MPVSLTRELAKWHASKQRKFPRRRQSFRVSIKDSAPGFNQLTGYKPDQERLLRVSCEHFTAGAIWKRTDGIWSCTRTAPIISWMRGMSPADAKFELARRNLDFSFLPLTTDPVRSPQDASSRPRPYQQHSDQSPSPAMLTPSGLLTGKAYTPGTRGTGSTVIPANSRGTNQTDGFTP